MKDAGRPRSRRGPRNAARLIALAALAALACNEQPAREAIAAAEQALAAAPDLATQDPGEHAAVSALLAQARASFAQGHYTDALRAALPVPDRVVAATQAAARKPTPAPTPTPALPPAAPPTLPPAPATPPPTAPPTAAPGGP